MFSGQDPCGWAGPRTMPNMRKGVEPRDAQAGFAALRLCATPSVPLSCLSCVSWFLQSLLPKVLFCQTNPTSDVFAAHIFAANVSAPIFQRQPATRPFRVFRFFRGQGSKRYRAQPPNMPNMRKGVEPRAETPRPALRLCATPSGPLSCLSCVSWFLQSLLPKVPFYQTNPTSYSKKLASHSHTTIYNLRRSSRPPRLRAGGCRREGGFAAIADER
jgi:hypothetical protein